MSILVTVNEVEENLSPIIQALHCFEYAQSKGLNVDEVWQEFRDVAFELLEISNRSKYFDKVVTK